MNRRTEKYFRNKFKNWKMKVGKHLPSYIISFYIAKSNSIWHTPQIEQTLGEVIADINNPYYSLIFMGKRLTPAEELTDQILLELKVNDIFKFINTKCR
jgi:hypothetical protein